MRSTRLRLVLFLGLATVFFAVIGSGVVDGQALPVPEAELPDGVKDAGDYAPPDWDGSGTHPGAADFQTYCAACHTLSSEMLVGPGFAGLYQRIEEGEEYEGKDPYARTLEYLKELDPLDPESVKDPYFLRVQEEVAGPGAQMSARGGMPADSTDRRFLNVIDYIFRFRTPDFDEAAYMKKVKLGRDLVSGKRGFKWGGPSCIGCHSVGPDEDLMGGFASNIGHTYVLSREIGRDDKRNYADGLYHLLSSEDAPAMHYWYRDVEGSNPLTDEELEAVVTYFEFAARETGTEKSSNYLPILALLFAALTILLLEPGVVNLLFAREDHEYVDGPYKPEEHHGEEEHAEEKAEDKPEEMKGEKDGQEDKEEVDEEAGKEEEGKEKEEAGKGEEQDASEAKPSDDTEDKADEEPKGTAENTENTKEDTGDGEDKPDDEPGKDDKDKD